jgi:hypothetical protein
MCATQRDKFIISEINGPDYPIAFILWGMLKDNEGEMK